MNDPTPQNAALVRQEFGASVAMTGAQMQSEALAAQVKANVEARYILAMRRPRNLDTVRTKLMSECRRPRFADEARYSVPRGRKQNAQGEWVDNMVEGPSIRFAEAAARCMSNIDIGTIVIYDDANSRQVRVTAIDLESNLTYYKDITVTKTQEKRDLRKGQVALGERYTSTGQLVHIVAIPDSELQNVQAAAESKALRTLLLRLVPGDITDECMDLCVAVIKDEHAKDPRAAIKMMCDGFARLGVQPDELVQYLGHPLDQMTPAEYQHLRSLGIALRDGQITWADALEQKLEGRPVVPATPAGTPAAATPATGGAPTTTTEQAQPAAAAGAAPAPAKEPARPKGTKAVTQQARATAAKAEPPKESAPPATPGPGSAEWEAAKARAAAAPPPPPAEPEADPHGDPPPPDNVPLPGADHSAGDAPDWMA
jgi:hypothetical protein